ncbi:gcvH: glycine cleavage system H protein [Rubrobacter radiotolerans]|uniref:Glycine cleavage system H protein n=1 Tax=Rubrobacter radiotolerans TaxID=42256 RepID=A0A023X6S0_RUBRA|nr:glycine cleavage system protein GcvH [Rubrobacter radiotolerans]AHY48023.1 gcvH: glycine cleavage system H protein [Rubrobacter radiotolerans]MDX5892662.1 glycine cleavage system protein GcvH [Rubrobacter radiotolerans]SMC08053.1 glycine cleavage system H protein [Rubrobacter radiotolerans DSM 5868]
MSLPEDLKYAKTHEWARIEDGTATVGITEHAAEELGDVVYVELPGVGDTFEAGESFGTVESVKAVSDLYAPVSGEVVEVNEALEDSPEKINEDAYGEGWILRLQTSDTGDNLLSAADYEETLAESE